jgi:hypothetical protein
VHFVVVLKPVCKLEHDAGGVVQLVDVHVVALERLTKDSAIPLLSRIISPVMAALVAM